MGSGSEFQKTNAEDKLLAVNHINDLLIVPQCIRLYVDVKIEKTVNT
jgi:hypothetical protein